MDIVTITIEHLKEYGPEKLEQIMLDNIENEGKTIKISGTLLVEGVTTNSIEKYNTEAIPNSIRGDAKFFRKDT